MATYKYVMNPHTGRLQKVLDDTALSLPENLPDLSDVDFDSGTPTDGQVLTYDNASGKWKAEDASGSENTIFTNTIELQANGANYETINHALAQQFVQATVMFQPSTGTYQDQWINGESVLTIVYHDENNIRLYNDSGSAIAIGKAKIIIHK